MPHILPVIYNITKIGPSYNISNNNFDGTIFQADIVLSMTGTSFYAMAFLSNMEAGTNSPARQDSCAKISDHAPPEGLPEQCA